VDKERRQNRELVQLLAVGACGVVVELAGTARGEHGMLVASLGLLITLGGAFAFCGYHRQEQRGAPR